MDDPIANFCAVTGASPEQAQQYLDIADGNLENAVMLFMESGGNTEPARPSAIPALQDPQRDSGGSWDEVRQPIAPTRDVLMGDIYDNFGDDMSDQFDNDPFGRDAGNDRLANLFAPPTDIMFRGNLEEARRVARENQKWIIVTLHDPTEFPCQILNRDLWKDKAVKDTVRSSFIFLQFPAASNDGRLYKNFYPVETLPHIAIIDPRTGERVKVWSSAVSPAEMMLDLMDFLEVHSLTSNSEAPRSRKVQDMTEDEQIAAAIAASVSREPGSEESPLIIESEDEPEVDQAAKANHDLMPNERPEPSIGADITTIQFRLPEGKRIVKKFEKSDRIKVLFQHLKAVEPELQKKPFELVFNREPLSAKLEATLAEAKVIQAAINLDYL